MNLNVYVHDAEMPLNATFFSVRRVNTTCPACKGNIGDRGQIREPDKPSVTATRCRNCMEVYNLSKDNTSDAKFLGTYAATVNGKRVEITASVEAADIWAASDKLRAMLEKKHGMDLINPVVRWQTSTSRLSAGSVSLAVMLGAGAEES